MPFLHLMLLGLITCAEDITHSKTNVVLLHSKCTGHTTKETFRDCSVNISLVNQAGRESKKSYSARWPVVTLLQRQSWFFFTCQSWYIHPPSITSRLLPKTRTSPTIQQTKARRENASVGFWKHQMTIRNSNAPVEEQASNPENELFSWFIWNNF